MSIFLRLSDRFETGLRIFDPFHNERLFRLVDPWPPGRKGAALPWWRAATLVTLLLAPVWLFCWMESGLLVNNGLVGDLGFYGVTIFSALFVILIPLARRLLGALLHELVLQGVVEPEIEGFSPRTAAKGRILTALEWLTRVDGYRGWVWIALLLAWQAYAYRVILHDGHAGWSVVAARPGLFYPVRVGQWQPTLSGVWFMLGVSIANQYMGVLAARLMVVFACLCDGIARSSDLRIVPADPDGVGGLKPIGQVALFLSLFPFSVGLSLAAMSSRQYLLPIIQGSPTPSLTGNNLIMAGFWVVYLLLGSLLFFLPLVPLRRRMAEAKRGYLLRARKLKERAEETHGEDLSERRFEPGSLQGLVALDSLIASASEMAIWPFDRQTFLRYAGLLGAPLAPIIAEALPHVVGWLKRYLGLAS